MYIIICFKDMLVEVSRYLVRCKWFNFIVRLIFMIWLLLDLNDFIYLFLDFCIIVIYLVMLFVVILSFE